jgi:hypothetical protein
MKINNTPTFTPPFSKYGNDRKVEEIQYRDTDHTPYNKRPGQCESQLTFRATRHNEGDTISFLMTEITTTHNFDTGKDRVAGRDISTTIHIDEAEKLANFILELVAKRKAAKVA